MKIISHSAKHWFDLSDKVRFSVIGCINAIIMYLIYSFFTLIIGNNFYQVSLVLAWIISSISSFFMHRNFVFHSKGSLIMQYKKCCNIWFISYLINALILELLIQNFNLNVYLSQIIAPTLAGIFTYFMFREYALKKRGYNPRIKVE